jgi:lipoic acid synthetase
MSSPMHNRPRLPHWMKMKMPSGEDYSRIKNIVERFQLHTICSSGNCPNIGECWGRGIATLMILGDICTRSCKFCGVKTGKPAPVDWEEPSHVAQSVHLMNLKHCVITSVDRDDLEDGGAGLWTCTIKEIKKVNPDTTIEALIPDFRGNEDNLQMVISSGADVISHNLETVKRLTPSVRSVANYKISLGVLKLIAARGVTAKTGIMLGLGEEEFEILETMDDALKAGCSVFTLGQYLAPSIMHFPVLKYIEPREFDKYKQAGLAKGFRFVESSPLVRSSYCAEKHVSSPDSLTHSSYL